MSDPINYFPVPFEVISIFPAHDRFFVQRTGWALNDADPLC